MDFDQEGLLNVGISLEVFQVTRDPFGGLSEGMLLRIFLKVPLIRLTRQFSEVSFQILFSVSSEHPQNRLAKSSQGISEFGLRNELIEQYMQFTWCICR